MEELVDKLALLQAELKIATDGVVADRIIADYTAKIVELEKQASEHRDALYDLVTVYGQDLLVEQIDEIKDQIIDEWTGEKKTMVFGDRVLKFTQRGSLKIVDEMYLFAELYDHVTIDELVEKYLKGFNLTAVKKYMGVHELPIDVAEIEYKTTVKLEQKSG